MILCITLSLSAIDRDHIAYLMQSRELHASLEMYEEYRKELGRHDFEILQQLGMIIIEQGVRSGDMEAQLLSIFGAAIAGLSSSIDILDEGIRSPHFETQMASIQFLARMQDDRCDDLLTKAMSSNFLMARMEAGYHLSTRKHQKAAGQIESLMCKIPQELWFYFPQFFALIGTSEAIGVLRQLIENPNSMVRVEAILSAARFDRDDLLGKIRAHATHLHIDEQEASAAALGFLKDSKSIPQLKKLSESSAENVKLAALRSLYFLGDISALDKIIEIAKKQSLFAIALLGDFSGGEDLLAELSTHKNIHVRINSAISLLKRRDPRAILPIEEILIRDTRELGFQPSVSVGHSLMAWKVVPSFPQHGELPYDLYALTLQLREQILADCLELKESDFLKVAAHIFNMRQGDLIPLNVALLENLQTEGAIKLLKMHANRTGAPLIRGYCNLALYRLNQPGNHEKVLREWISRVKTTELIRFRPMLPWDKRSGHESPYELTPEESSRLLIEIYQALSDRHDEIGIDILLDGIKTGHPKNKYALAGLLIRAIQ